MDAKNSFPNYAKYVEFTANHDWKGIAEVNGLADFFGTKKELKVLPSYLHEGETVFALTSGIAKQGTKSSTDWGTNTWLVALTSERFLFLDHAMLTKSVDSRSIRLSAVRSVSADQGLLFGSIRIDSGSDDISLDNCQKQTVDTIARLANLWLSLQEKEKTTSHQSEVDQARADSAEIITTLKQQNQLLYQQMKDQKTVIALLQQLLVSQDRGSVEVIGQKFK